MQKKYKVNVLDALYFLRQSWNQVSKNTIKKYFQKAEFPGTQLESDLNDEDIAPSIQIAPAIGFNYYVLCDDGLSICSTEVSEIGELSEKVNNDSETEIDNQTPSETVTFSNALKVWEL